MARRRVKKRTHVGANSGAAKKGASTVSPRERTPKSMVVRIGAGEVGPSISQLVKDMRAVLEPGTASRLQERKANKLKDYTTMAGPLGVTHLLLFSRSLAGNTSFRLALTPRGPTLHFKVDKYSLCKDVQKAMKHPKGLGTHFLAPPLLVMNNFVSNRDTEKDAPAANAVPRHLETLTTTIFQSMFPPISPQSTSLSSIRRVLLLNREPHSNASDASGTFTINLRHYAITTKPTSLSKGVRRLNVAEKRAKKQNSGNALPNLGRLDDVADLILDPSAAAGYTSESEIETDAEIEVMPIVTKQVLSAQKRAKERERRQAQPEEDLNSDSEKPRPRYEAPVEKRAVKLVEIGPRLKLRMIKVEEGVCEGKVMWHEFMHKTKEEQAELEQYWKDKKTLKEQRKREQKENVLRKRKPQKGEDVDMEDEEVWASESEDE